jgi:hypothetical protein
VGTTEYTDFHARFQLEAQLGAKLDHPNIIQVHDFEQDRKTLILVMEYAEGGNLASRIQRAREKDQLLPLEETIQIGIDVAQGLSALHAMDTIHRDLKPSNILFDKNGHAKVADLGLAQIPGGPSLRSRLSQPLPHPGTPGYMSPEQEHTGNLLRPASDMYALGIVLFEILTGRNYNYLKPGTRASELRPDTPDWLDNLIARMLADEPKDRPWDGAEAAKLLQEGMVKEEAKRREEAAQREADERTRREEQARLQRAAEERARREAEERARKEVEQRDAEIARLLIAAPIAIGHHNWDKVNIIVDELSKLGDEGQAEAAELKEQIIQAQIKAKEKTRREGKQPITKKLKWWIVTVVLLAIVLVCGVSLVLGSKLLPIIFQATSTPVTSATHTFSLSPNAAYTLAPQTVQAELTRGALTQSLPISTIMPTATPISTNALQPTSTPTPVSCNKASFVVDVTVPDGTIMTPGQSFTKIWRMKNIGSCTWSPNYQLVFDHGDAMSGPAYQPLISNSVAPGYMVDISVNLIAPTAPGTYRGYWKIRDPNGALVSLAGEVTFWVEIKVVK